MRIFFVASSRFAFGLDMRKYYYRKENNASGVIHRCIIKRLQFILYLIQLPERSGNGKFASARLYDNHSFRNPKGNRKTSLCSFSPHISAVFPSSVIPRLSLTRRKDIWGLTESSLRHLYIVCGEGEELGKHLKSVAEEKT